LSSERVDLVDDHDSHAVIVSALPPKAALHARHLLKRLSARRPDLKVIVGLWTDPLDPAKAAHRDFGDLTAASSLKQAIEQLEQLTQSILLDTANAAANHADKTLSSAK
jgi:hypothetical protein